MVDSRSYCYPVQAFGLKVEDLEIAVELFVGHTIHNRHKPLYARLRKIELRLGLELGLGLGLELGLGLGLGLPGTAPLSLPPSGFGTRVSYSSPKYAHMYVNIRTHVCKYVNVNM